MDRRVACCVVGLLVVAGVVGAAAATATPDSAAGLSQEFDPDQVSLAAHLQPDGDAAWTITYRMRLATENETQAFKSLQQDIRNNQSVYVRQFRRDMSGTIAAAENATSRNMSMTNVSVSTRINTLNDPSLGVVTYSFTWTNFAAVDGDRIIAGDALEGIYLDNETSLLISWPDRYAVVEVDPQTGGPRENAVKWSGPIEFAAGQPSVVVAPAQEPTTSSTTAPPASDAGGGSVLLPVVGGALVAVVVLGGAAFLYWRRSRGEGAPPSGGTGSGAGGGGTGGGAAAGGAPSAEETADEPPEELLSNEERVKRFLREQGGRAKQQDVVEEMGWTEAKTSQVVKEMRESDELESFRIGRENVLKLPDADDIDE